MSSLTDCERCGDPVPPRKRVERGEGSEPGAFHVFHESCHRERMAEIAEREETNHSLAEWFDE